MSWFKKIENTGQQWLGPWLRSAQRSGLIPSEISSAAISRIPGSKPAPAWIGVPTIDSFAQGRLMLPVPHVPDATAIIEDRCGFVRLGFRVDAEEGSWTQWMPGISTFPDALGIIEDTRLGFTVSMSFFTPIGPVRTNRLRFDGIEGEFRLKGSDRAPWSFGGCDVDPCGQKVFLLEASS